MHIIRKVQTLSRILKKRLPRVRAGLETWGELFWFLCDVKRSGINPESNLKLHAISRRRNTYLRSEYYQIGDVRLPLLDKLGEKTLFNSVFEDTFYCYIHSGDCYDEQTIDKYFTLFKEGPYGLKNDQVDVRICKGDIVIDAGSWIGDFAAYASIKGATTYAFEPATLTYEYLCKTAKLNRNIIPIKKGLGDKDTHVIMANDNCNYSNSILQERWHGKDIAEIETTTIDTFVRENNLPRVDFIKADIEGYERNMLLGARETLARFAPKLALCTYHLPDDPEVLERLIREANPAYKVVQKRKKLFASV